MLQFSFLQEIESYQKIYHNFPLPVLICDTGLEVYWSNTQAKKAYPLLTSPTGLKDVLAEYCPSELFETMSTTGSCTITGAVTLSQLSVSLVPIHDHLSPIGAVIMLLSENDPAAHNSPYMMSQRADAFSSRIRDNIGLVFDSMDAVAQKSHMLGQQWVKQELNQIAVESYGILRIAGNISEYSRFQSGVANLSRGTMDITRLFADIEDTVVELGASMNVPISFDYPDFPCFISGDRSRLELAVFNLIHNSLYFTKKENRITVSLTQDIGCMIVSVSDRGLGMPKDCLEHVWRPYWTYTHGGNGAGIGLGLSLVKAITEGLGGLTGIESVEGEGTTVTMRLLPGSLNSPLSLRQNDDDASKPGDRFSRIYIGLTDAVKSPYMD